MGRSVPTVAKVGGPLMFCDVSDWVISRSVWIRPQSGARPQLDNRPNIVPAVKPTAWRGNPHLVAESRPSRR